jgi:hypothetical protein
MSKRKKDVCDCREDKRTQWEKERDERVEKTIHRNRYPVLSPAQVFEACRRADALKSK